MYLDPSYVNEQLVHLLLFTQYNLVIKEFSNLELLKPLFSIVDGYQFEQINMSEFEDLDTLEKVIENLSSVSVKTIIAFFNPVSEFLFEILGTKKYRFVLLVNETCSFWDCIHSLSSDRQLWARE